MSPRSWQWLYRSRNFLLLSTFALTGAWISSGDLALAAPTKSAKPVKSPKPGKATSKKAPTPKKVPTLAQSSLTQRYLASIKPAPSGPGVVVGEPRTSNSKEAPRMVAFGAACSRWLQFHIGGQGELGKTPLWSSIDSVSVTLKHADAHFEAKEAPALAQRLGVTHLVSGTIRAQDATHYELSYLLNNTTLAPSIQSRFTLAGTEAEILAQLPDLAKSLSVSLGVKSPHLPQVITLSPNQWLLLGQGHWISAGALTDADLETLSELAPKEALAAFLVYEYICTRDGDFADALLKEGMARCVIEQTGGYPIALAELGSLDIYSLLPFRDTLDANDKKYPYNYGAHVVETYWYKSWSERNLPRQFAYQAVRSSPHNADAWLLYAGTWSKVGSDVRQGRVAGDITEKEWDFLRECYANWEHAARGAATFDADNAAAWEDLALAATFNGDTHVADGAFWKAYRLSPKRTTLLSWGLQMYQFKWGGNPETLLKLIDITTQPALLIAMSPEAAAALRSLGKEDEAKQLEAKVRYAIHVRLQENPTDIQALYWSSFYTRDPNEIRARYEAIRRQRPRSHYVQWLLSNSYQPYSNDKAIDAMREAIRLAPQRIYYRRELGLLLTRNEKYEEAESQINQFLKQYPDDWRGHVYLAWNDYLQDKVEAALASCARAEAVNPHIHSSGFRYSQCDMLTRLGKFDEAIKNGQLGVQDEPNSAWAHAFLAWAYLKKGRIDDAMVSCQRAMQLDAGNSALRQCLGEIYLAKGQINRARAEWQIVINGAGPTYNGKPKSRVQDRRSLYYAAMAKARLEKYVQEPEDGSRAL